LVPWRAFSAALALEELRHLARAHPEPFQKHYQHVVCGAKGPVTVR
jgi:hypothetical protein